MSEYFDTDSLNDNYDYFYVGGRHSGTVHKYKERLNKMYGENKEEFKPSRELKRAVNNYWLYAVEHSKAHMNREERRRAKKNGKRR